MHRGLKFLLVPAALALAVMGPATAAAAAPSRQAQAQLERVILELQREGDRLEQRLRGPRVGGADWAVDLQAELITTEVRVWGWRVAASEALGALLGSAVAAQVQAAATPSSSIPALGLVAADSTELAQLRPVLNDWAVYRRALGRVLGLLEDLRAGSRIGQAPGLLAPGRVCPVAGPHRFEHTWGEERPWGRAHKGEDVHAAWGTPLVAIESGTIVQSGWHWSGGFGVYLEGYYSGDVYYYAHMSWTAPGVHPGAVVEVGDLLGWVGATGNAESPHLHLGWIPDNLGRWVDLEGLADPYPLLMGLCGGF